MTISGGNITVCSNDDGLHADSILSVKAGTVSVANAYEGLEGTQINISCGYVSVNSKDDGIDSNSRTADVGIVFSGGKTVVISNSGMNSALATENGVAWN